MNYTYIDTASKLEDALPKLRQCSEYAFDLETTGLDPRKNEIRTLTICPTEDPHPYIIDTWKVGEAWKQIFPVMQERTGIGHYLYFDLGFLSYRGYSPGKVFDTILASQLLHLGRNHRHSLKAVSREHLNVDLDKDIDHKVWLEPELPPHALQYAAEDTRGLALLKQAMTLKLRDEGLLQVLDIENEFLPFLVWMATTGVPFNTEAWHEAVIEAEKEKRALEIIMNGLAPTNPQGALFHPDEEIILPTPSDAWFTGDEEEDAKPKFTNAGWCWDDTPTLKNLLKQLGYHGRDWKDLSLAMWNHPISQHIRKWNSAKHLLENYGLKWLQKPVNGRIYPEWIQIKNTGRMGCREPSFQNIPRRKSFRKGIAATEGYILVKRDYSQIELRMGAFIAPDEDMKRAYMEGEDLHILTASKVLGVPVEQITKEQRQDGKIINFGFLFGLMPPGFISYAKQLYGKDFTLRESTNLRYGYMQAYKGIQRWHKRTENDKQAQVRTLTGRRRYLPDSNCMTLKLNTPVQGSAADGAKMAGALCWQRRHELPSGTQPIIINHDEIVFETKEGQEEEVSEWLKKNMLEGMQSLIHPVPVETEPTIARTWAG